MITYKRGHLSIAFVCMVLGFMLALQFRIAMDQKASLPYQRVEELSARLIETEKERDALQEKVASLQQVQPAPGNTEGEQMLRELRLRSGLTALTDPGVIVGDFRQRPAAHGDFGDSLRGAYAFRNQCAFGAAV